MNISLALLEESYRMTDKTHETIQHIVTGMAVTLIALGMMVMVYKIKLHDDAQRLQEKQLEIKEEQVRPRKIWERDDKRPEAEDH